MRHSHGRGMDAARRLVWVRSQECAHLCLLLAEEKKKKKEGGTDVALGRILPRLLTPFLESDLACFFAEEAHAEGSFLVSGAVDRSTGLRSVLHRTRALPPRLASRVVGVSADGLALARAVADGTGVQITISTGEQVHEVRMPGDRRTQELNCSIQGCLAVAWSRRPWNPSQIWIVNIHSGSVHEAGGLEGFGEVRDVAFAPRTDGLAVGERFGGLKSFVLDASGCRLSWQVPVSNGLDCLTYNSSGDAVVVVSGNNSGVGEIRAFAADTGNSLWVRSLKGCGDPCGARDLAVSADGEALAFRRIHPPEAIEDWIMVAPLYGPEQAGEELFWPPGAGFDESMSLAFVESRGVSELLVATSRSICSWDVQGRAMLWQLTMPENVRALKVLGYPAASADFARGGRGEASEGTEVIQDAPQL